MKNRSLINYSWWVDYKGVWELKQAANLYLGFDPDVGGTFDRFEDLLATHDRGLILTDSETVWSVSVLKIPVPNTEWDDVFDKDGNCKISRQAFIKDKIKACEIQNVSDDVFDKDGTCKVSLDAFIRDRIRAGEIKIISDDDLGIYFNPIEIILFFQTHFLNRPPQDLLEALGINVAQKKKAQPISVKMLEKEYKKYVVSCESKGLKPTWETDWTAMEDALGKRPTKNQIKTVRAKLAPKSWKIQGRRRAA